LKAFSCLANAFATLLFRAKKLHLKRITAIFKDARIQRAIREGKRAC
jgi:hypothetical protein